MAKKISKEGRRKALLGILQRESGSLITEELHAQQSHWIEQIPHLKTTLRDLKALASEGLVSGEKPFGQKSYRWKLRKARLDLALTPSESMTLVAILQHAERFGFKVVADQLVELRDYALGVISRNSKHDLVGQGRITTGTRFMTLLPGAYEPAHLETIQAAMLEGQTLEVVYKPRDVGDIKCTYILKPLALSFQDSNIYLSAFVESEQWPKGKAPKPDTPRGKYSSNGPGKQCVLMLHRMVSAKTYWRDTPEPEGYRVGSFEVQRDLMTIHDEAPIGLKLRLKPNLLNRLTENPLRDNQQIKHTSAGAILECCIQDTQGLRLFLLSNADEIEVLEPNYLRDHTKNALRRALEMYAGDEM
ncbi:WYL domain-containing protein [Pseudomonas putida]|uniref:helix-turn-helix transcriptional regulator n=1 Tax=Pseudomonas putida TaxID=303 RepID=UPI00345DFF33